MGCKFLEALIADDTAEINTPRFIYRWTATSGPLPIESALKIDLVRAILTINNNTTMRKAYYKSKNIG